MLHAVTVAGIRQVAAPKTTMSCFYILFQHVFNKQDAALDLLQGMFFSTVDGAS